MPLAPIWPRRQLPEGRERERERVVGTGGLGGERGASNPAALDVAVRACAVQVEGSWAWSDGSTLVFEDWGIGEPDGVTSVNGKDCAAIVSGSWNDRGCDKTSARHTRSPQPTPLSASHTSHFPHYLPLPGVRHMHAHTHTPVHAHVCACLLRACAHATRTRPAAAAATARRRRRRWLPLPQVHRAPALATLALRGSRGPQVRRRRRHRARPAERQPNHRLPLPGFLPLLLDRDPSGLAHLRARRGVLFRTHPRVTRGPWTGGWRHTPPLPLHWRSSGASGCAAPQTPHQVAGATRYPSTAATGPGPGCVRRRTTRPITPRTPAQQRARTPPPARATPP